MKNEELAPLYRQQVRDFPLAHENYTGLQNAVYRTVSSGTFNFRIQYNPARIVSTGAKIDPVTLQNRKCFLCPEHMPREQQGLPYGGQYHIFINPYPIFKEHYTVPADLHTPQILGNRLEDMLNLAFDFSAYTVFYNGPDCGASAPDHFHFQIAPQGVMPLEEDTCNPELSRTIVKKDFYTITTLENYLRPVILLKGSDLKLLSRQFDQIRNIIGEEIPFDTEPKMNILTWFDNCQWSVCIFPRTARRPRQFYEEGEDKILFSPGCVDMAGLIIAPRKEDFERYSLPLLTDLFSQVTPSPQEWQNIINQLKKL